MKIVSGSDLHLEHHDLKQNFGLSDAFLDNASVADVLILAGDIIDTDLIFNSRVLAVFSRLADAYKNVIMVMGNHEHYGGDFANTHDRIGRFLSPFPNVHLLEKRGVTIDGTRFFGGTMWTSFNNGDAIAMYAAKRNMNDFGYIENTNAVVNFKSKDADGGVTFHTRSGTFRPLDAYDDHKAFLVALHKDFEENKGAQYAVVTHHTPSFSLCHSMFGNDTLNHAYHSNLDNLILDNPQIKAWYCGHTHGRKRVQIGECELILNARGYASESMSNSFELTEKEIL